MTAYVILKQNKVEANSASGAMRPGDWHEIGPPVDAVSAEAAIRKAVDGDGGKFVAIPVRSFAPVTVTVETKRTLSIA